MATVTSNAAEKEDQAGQKLAIEVVDAANGSVSDPTTVNGNWVREGLALAPGAAGLVKQSLPASCVTWLRVPAETYPLTQLPLAHPPTPTGEVCGGRGPLRLGPQGPAGCA